MSHNEEGLTWHDSSLEQNGGKPSILSPKEHEAPKLCRKSKAGSGPATDAQSIYLCKSKSPLKDISLVRIWIQVNYAESQYVIMILVNVTL